MLVGVILCKPRQTVLLEEMIALEKAGCERFHIVDSRCDLDSLRQLLAPTDILVEAASRQGIREIRLH
jgi:predicted dinucleotide-utilizing enzyme